MTSGWRRRGRGPSGKRAAEEALAEAAIEARVQSFGPYGRGIVSGADLTPDGAARTAKQLYDAGDRDGAVALWRQAAEAGSASAAADLVIECSADGDYAEALRWYRTARRRGMDIPPHDPGVRLRSLGQHRERAAEGWWRTAAEKFQDDRSCEYLGISLRERGETAEAGTWLAQGAARGDAACSRELAVLAGLALDSATSADARQAAGLAMLHWARLAADGGDARAREYLRNLGVDG
ncbi:hypothetical protein [Streptomyces sp. MAR4 CNX-425]|uniref:hypothetical protein n=1 Tax=Streptomyces sp. MAR4 CNX-425 TaxID=3406343 RepID=UPI003B50FB5C